MTGIPDPDCPHCRTPGYPHRHWRQDGTPAEPRPDGWAWRLAFKIMGNGSGRAR